MKATVGLVCIGVFTCFGTEQLIFLLELFQPDWAVHLCMALRAPHGRGKEHGLVPDDVVAQRKSLALVIPGPIRQSTLDIRKFPLGPFDGRSAPIFRVEIFLFLPQDFGNRTTRKMLAAEIVPHCSHRIHHTFFRLQRALVGIVSIPSPDPGSQFSLLTSNFGLFNCWMIFVILTHSSSVLVRQSFPGGGRRWRARSGWSRMRRVDGRYGSESAG